MSLRIELREQPRVFDVFVGERAIGKVTSYISKEDEASDSPYEALLFTEKDDGEETDLGWHSTLALAAEAVIEYEHGAGKINKIVERNV